MAVGKIKVARTADEISKVDKSEPVAIQLPAEEPKVEAKKPDGEKRLPTPETPDPNEPSLQKQLTQLKASEERARESAHQAEIQRNAALQQAQQREAENQRLRSATTSAQRDSILNAIASCKAEADNAQIAYASALANNDHMAAAEAQRRMSKADARLVTLEAGRAEIERTQKTQPQQRPSPQSAPPQPQPQNIEQMLAAMPALNERERDYLREHPEAIMDPANQRRLEVAFLDAQSKGLKRGSDEYFRFFDDRLGYETKNDEDTMDYDDSASSKMVAAPVSRSAGAPQESSTRIVLSPQQRAAAEWAGIDEFTYAKNLLKLRQMKKDGYYEG